MAVNFAGLTGSLVGIKTGTSSGGKTYFRAGLLHKRYGDDKPRIMDFVCWSKLAETCAAHLQKGDTVTVTGSLDVATDEYEGVTRKQVAIFADQVHFIRLKTWRTGAEVAK